MAKRRFGKAVLLLGAAFSLAATTAAAQTFTTLYNFCSQLQCADGEAPATPMVQGTDGNLYGTTSAGGTAGQGTVFKITTDARLTTVHTFCTQRPCLDGSGPQALVLATDGNFYGTTSVDGAHGGGTVFRMTPGGNLTTLYSFCSQRYCTDGYSPYAGLVQGADGNLYGTTYYGGAFGAGTVFKITPTGSFTTLYTFCSESNCADGAGPDAGLIQGWDGNFYGTTEDGGANDACGGTGYYTGCGTVFKITPSGSLTTLYSFCSQSDCLDGELPQAGLVQGTDGNFYGTTGRGGIKINSSGTVFRVTPAGVLTTLHNFARGADGRWPHAGLIQATDRKFYGTATFGGGDFLGTLFEIAGGSLTVLHNFTTDAYWPYAEVFQATNGTFYGTTYGHYGAVYSLSLSPPLNPFVETLPSSGAAGMKVIILGNNLTGATRVRFNGTAVQFTVNSTGTAIVTAVPGGATSGYVEVTTPAGTLTSNAKFRVR